MYSGGTARNVARDRIVDREVAKLEIKTPATRSFKQFSTLTTIDGFQVIDNATGHPVVERDSRRSAAGIAHSLNLAAADSPEALAHALGARR